MVFSSVWFISAELRGLEALHLLLIKEKRKADVEDIKRENRRERNSSELSTCKVEFAHENAGVEFAHLIILTCRSASEVIRDAAVFLIYFLRSSSCLWRVIIF